MIEDKDINSKYCHSMINWRRIKNEIKIVKFQGKLCEEYRVVKDKIKEFFFFKRE